MTIFFSGSASNGKGAFFDDDGFHTADQIPKDAVPVTPERYAELFGPNGQGGGGFMILPDANGAPSLVPVPPPSTEQLLANLRATRDNLLAASDWTQAGDAPISPTLVAAWKTYRQALRDLPATVVAGSNDPTPGKFSWPSPPV